MKHLKALELIECSIAIDQTLQFCASSETIEFLKYAPLCHNADFYISGLCKLRNLRKMEIMFPEISTEHARQLAKSLVNLHELDIESPSLDEWKQEQLTAICCLPALERLRMDVRTNLTPLIKACCEAAAFPSECDVLVHAAMNVRFDQLVIDGALLSKAIEARLATEPHFRLTVGLDQQPEVLIQTWDD